MDSLVANYASSDEEEEPQSLQPHPPSSLPDPNPKSSFFASLPHPKSSSSSPSSLLFSSLPKPKTSQPSTTIFHDEEPQKSPNPTSKLFSSLPLPKSEKPISASASKPKRVVQIRAPINPFARKSVDDDDDEEEEERERKRRNESESSAEAPSVKSFLSSIPAPRNSASLGALPTLGSGRRAIVEADVPASSLGIAENQDSVIVEQSVEDYGNYAGNYGTYEHSNNQNYVDNAGYYGTCEFGGVDQYNGGVDSYNYGNNQSYGNFGNNWADGSAAMVAPEVSAVSERAFRVPGKRGRNDIPIEIVEVKQDELMKNRPREDQAKLTGIAFGPSYQPASSKGKPSKLHKRKHQIGTLYFDMKQKETELAERRAKGFLTKAETQAKYGW